MSLKIKCYFNVEKFYFIFVDFLLFFIHSSLPFVFFLSSTLWLCVCMYKSIKCKIQHRGDLLRIIFALNFLMFSCVALCSHECYKLQKKKNLSLFLRLLFLYYVRHTSSNDGLYRIIGASFDTNARLETHNTHFTFD